MKFLNLGYQKEAYIYIYMKKNYRKKLKQIYEKVDLLEDLSFNFVIIYIAH